MAMGSAAFALLTCAPASAEDASEAAETRAPVRITIGPQSVEPGETRYAVRSTVAGKAAVVEFSATPPRLSTMRTSQPFSGGVPSGMPVSARLTSGFGWRTHPILGGTRAHAGVDLAAPYGSPIVATANGVVGAAGWSGGYGLLVAISHGDGVQTRYGHMSRLAVAPGQQVSRGDVIGYVGSTGQSTGPHVHYEVRVNGAAIDPLGR
jgi:murein DD-endopeptidase MepM/ murein hydrolase activator NlpD